MAESLIATISGQLFATLTGNSSNVGQGSFTPSLQNFLNVAFSNGVGLNQANTLYVDERTLAGSATEDIDMYAFGAAVDQVGSTRTNARIKAIIIINKNVTNANSLSIGGKATSAAFGVGSLFGTNTDKLIVPGNGYLVLVCPDATGWPVTNVTNLLKILNNTANSVTYDIAVIGANA